MLKGKIKTFIEDKKFGFITQEDQTDLFFHISQLPTDYTPQKNDIVAYETKPSPKKEGQFEAKNIIFLKEETENLVREREKEQDKENNKIYEGKIEWFNSLKGFGLINSQELGNVLFHVNKVGQINGLEKDIYVNFKASQKNSKYEVIYLEVDKYKFFFNSSRNKRKNIFNQLNQEEQKKFLEYCQENVTTNQQLYELWLDDCEVKPNFEYITQKFINTTPFATNRQLYRINIFLRLDKEEQKRLLEYCQQNATDEQLYELWKNDYDINPSFEFIFNTFVKGDTSGYHITYQRKNIFEKLNEEEQKQLLEYCQQNATDEQLYQLWKEQYDIWKEQYDIPYQIKFIFQQFILEIDKRKSIFQKLNEEEQKELLAYCQENLKDEQLYELLIDGYALKPSFEFLTQKFINTSYQRKNIFKKLNEEEQKQLLTYCQENLKEEQLYELWKENYNVKVTFEFLIQKFINYSWERNTIFNKLNEEEQKQLLEYCQENLKDEQLYQLWKENYNVKVTFEFIADKFINEMKTYYSNERKTIFNNLNEEEQKKLLTYCQENLKEEQLYQLWKENYNVKLNFQFLADKFINAKKNYYSNERKTIFNKLNEEEQKLFLTYCQENLKEEQLCELQEEGYNLNLTTKLLAWKFINITPHDKIGNTIMQNWMLKKRKQEFFYKLSEQNKKDLLDYCIDNFNIFQKLDLWIDGFVVDISKEIIETLIKQEDDDLWKKIESNIIDNQKDVLVEAFRKYEDYKILLWTYSVIDDFDWDSYAHNYFLLSRNNKRKFTKKAKLKLRQELDTKLLNSLESSTLIREENGIQIYEVGWRSIWYQDKSIRICIDASKPSFTYPYLWDYSEKSFNYLSSYISGRRVDSLEVHLQNNYITKIIGLEGLSEVIYKAYWQREINQKYRGGETYEKSITEPKLPQNIILKNICVQYLNLLQIPNLEPVHVSEYTLFDLEKTKRLDISLLYSLQLPNNEVAVIWESIDLEKSKATHIFKFFEDDYILFFERIKNNIEQLPFLRSRLRSKEKTEDIEVQIEMSYLGNIDHSNFDFEIWRKSLHNLLPMLSTPDGYHNLIPS